MTIKKPFIKEEYLLKIIGYFAMIIVSLVGWVLFTVYTMNGTVNTIKTNADHSDEYQRKMGAQVEENYTILQSKADEKENRIAHESLIESNKYIIGQVVTLEKKIDRNYDQRIRYGVVPKVDSVRYILQANSSKLDTIQNYTTEIKEILTTNTAYPIPYKEMNTYVENFNSH
jgi:hypothetical protein